MTPATVVETLSDRLAAGDDVGLRHQVGAWPT